MDRTRIFKALTRYAAHLLMQRGYIRAKGNEGVTPGHLIYDLDDVKVLVGWSADKDAVITIQQWFGVDIEGVERVLDRMKTGSWLDVRHTLAELAHDQLPEHILHHIIYKHYVKASCRATLFPAPAGARRTDESIRVTGMLTGAERYDYARFCDLDLDLPLVMFDNDATLKPKKCADRPTFSAPAPDPEDLRKLWSGEPEALQGNTTRFGFGQGMKQRLHHAAAHLMNFLIERGMVALDGEVNAGKTAVTLKKTYCMASWEPVNERVIQVRFWIGINFHNLGRVIHQWQQENRTLFEIKTYADLMRLDVEATASSGRKRPWLAAFDFRFNVGDERGDAFLYASEDGLDYFGTAVIRDAVEADITSFGQTDGDCFHMVPPTL
ncbi:hypothetical protein N7563_22145 [Leclercia adecarboxylata ATCC 23216 = NBRC 102595]|nr:hypothetical protein [Leclercia adecarboxylata ATCC 23216 = NBRC 102595]